MSGFLSERGAFAAVVGLALLIAVSYGVARLTGPTAGLVFGLAVAALFPLAAVAVRTIRTRLGPFGAAAQGLEPAGRARGNDELHREAFLERAQSGDGRRHLLVVADETCGARQSRSLGERALREHADVRVVAPALNSSLHRWTSDEDGARREAKERLTPILEALSRLGVEARGEVGAEDPLQAIDDTLRRFPVDEIVLATSAPETSNRFEREIVERARAAYALPVTQLVGERPHGMAGGGHPRGGTRTRLSRAGGRGSPRR